MSALSAASAFDLVSSQSVAHVIWFRSQGLAFITTPTPNPAGYSNTKALGSVLYTQYVYPFEIASVILLLAIIPVMLINIRRFQAQEAIR